jgi:D-threo-aldose 1-dehydrogenase
MHFALGHPAVGSLVIGSVSPSEVTRNVAALTTRVPAALWMDLKRELLLDASAPMPA